MIEAVIFDMDGLMFDTERITAEAWVYTGETLGFPITKEMAVSVIGLRDGDTRSLFCDALGPAFDYDRAVELRVEHMYSCIDERGLPVKKGLYALLDVIGALGLKAAVASSTERARVMYLLKKASIADRFDVIVCGDMVKRAKPEPDAFLLTARQLGVAPENCIVLEDSPYGITAAHRAGMTVIMTPDMIAPTPETDAMVLTTIASLDEAIPIIKAGKEDAL